MKSQGAVLVLNSDFSVINVIGWRRALRLLLKGRAEVVEESEKVIKNFEGTKTFKVPAIIKLIRFVKEVFRARITFSKKHVFVRDGMKCGYCPSKDNLTIDHVIPRSKGGRTTWENVITCCSACNRKKGNKTVSEANMHINSRIKLKQPSLSEFLKAKIDLFGISKSFRDTL